MANEDPQRSWMQVVGRAMGMIKMQNGKPLDPKNVAAELGLPKSTAEQLKKQLSKVDVADIREQISSLPGIAGQTMDQVDAVLSAIPQDTPITELNSHVERMFRDEGILRRVLGPNPAWRITKGTFRFLLVAAVFQLQYLGAVNLFRVVQYRRRAAAMAATAAKSTNKKPQAVSPVNYVTILLLVCTTLFTVYSAAELVQMATQAFQTVRALAQEAAMRRHTRQILQKMQQQQVVASVEQQQPSSSLARAWNWFIGRKADVA
jgi:DNA-binding IscR family transcriptional regulator